jgi:hypothetical protein
MKRGQAAARPAKPAPSVDVQKIVVFDKLPDVPESKVAALQQFLIKNTINKVRATL